MNSFEILRENKQAIAAIQENLFQVLKKPSEEKALELAKKGPTVETKETPIEFSVIALMRFSTQKGVATYALGSSDPNFVKHFQSLIPHNPPDPNTPSKSLEFELMRQYFAALEPVLKLQGFNIDMKSIVVQEGTSLGGWEKIQVDTVIKLPLSTKLGDLVFEIPLFNVEYVKNKTAELYGFKDGVRVLVVDDSAVSRKHARMCLAMGGYFNIEESPDGQTALSKVLGSRPPIELVVADWHMPNMSGFELLKKLRAVPELKKLPIILVTGEKNKDEVVNAIKEGVTAYLVKPVAPDQFLKALRKAGGLG